MTDVIILGASGHGRVVADIIERSGDRVVGYLDDNPALGGEFGGYPILGTIAGYKPDPSLEYVIAIGDSRIRERIAGEMSSAVWYTAIHPSAVISDHAYLGPGSVVMPMAVINSGAVIGEHCIINTSAVVEHDNVLGDYVHIAVGAKTAGTVHIGDRTWVGIGAVIINNIDIAPDCIIGAGATVIRNITEPGTYVGVPAHMV